MPSVNPPAFSSYNGETSFSYNGVVYKKAQNVGRGTWGEVSRFDPVDNPHLASVAVKSERLNASELFLEGKGFRFEAAVYQRLYGFGVFSGDAANNKKPHYVLMPYFKGVLFSKTQFDSVKQSIFLFICAAKFLHEKMHELSCDDKKKGLAGLVHGDIKMNNIILDDEGCKVVDFGLAAKVGSRLKPYGKQYNDRGEELSLHKVFPHIAPELFFSENIASASQDIYSLGNLLAQMMLQTKFISADQLKKTSLLVAALCHQVPELRMSIPEVIARLDAGFCSDIERPKVCFVVDAKSEVKKSDANRDSLFPNAGSENRKKLSEMDCAKAMKKNFQDPIKLTGLGNRLFKTVAFPSFKHVYMDLHWQHYGLNDAAHK